MDKKSLEQLQKWHEDGKHKEIIGAISEIPMEQRGYELTGLLARAYNNNDEYDKAIEQLLSVKEQGESDSFWWFRLGYAYYYKDGCEEKALEVFERCKELDSQHPDVDLFLGSLRTPLTWQAEHSSMSMSGDGDEKIYPEYWELHLEEADVPDNKYDFFDNDLSPAFYLDISNTTRGLCYECALDMSNDESENFEQLNARLAEKGYDADGYGWEQYLHNYIEEHEPVLHEKIGLDSELDTCGIYVYESRKDYYLLLKIISAAIRGLYVFEPTEKMPEIEYLSEMYGDDYYPAFLVDKVKAAFTAVVDFIMSGPHTYEEIQAAFDTCVIAINELEEEFYENDSEIETIARDSIGDTVYIILEQFGIEIDTETAIRERDW